MYSDGELKFTTLLRPRVCVFVITDLSHQQKFIFALLNINTLAGKKINTLACLHTYESLQMMGLEGRCEIYWCTGPSRAPETPFLRFFATRRRTGEIMSSPLYQKGFCPFSIANMNFSCEVLSISASQRSKYLGPAPKSLRRSIFPLTEKSHLTPAINNVGAPYKWAFAVRGLIQFLGHCSCNVSASDRISI